MNGPPFTEDVPVPIEPDEPEAGDLPLLRDLRQLEGAGCMSCTKRLCGHEVLFSVVMGLKNAPRCLTCLAEGLHRPVRELRDQLAAHIQRRACYRQAWDIASDREGWPRGRYPACLWHDAGPIGLDHHPPAAEEDATDERENLTIASAWDAGDLACGDLVLALRGRLGALPPGAVIRVTARDPAAPEDLPAWCRLTGHRLVRAEHPDYYIQRKEL